MLTLDNSSTWQSTKYLLKYNFKVFCTWHCHRHRASHYSLIGWNWVDLNPAVIFVSDSKESRNHFITANIFTHTHRCAWSVQTVTAVLLLLVHVDSVSHNRHNTLDKTHNTRNTDIKANTEILLTSTNTLGHSGTIRLHQQVQYLQLAVAFSCLLKLVLTLSQSHTLIHIIRRTLLL